MRQLLFISDSASQLTEPRLELTACPGGGWGSGLCCRCPTSDHTRATSSAAPGCTGPYFGISALTLLSAYSSLSPSSSLGNSDFPSRLSSGVTCRGLHTPPWPTVYFAYVCRDTVNQCWPPWSMHPFFGHNIPTHLPQ